VPRTARTIVQLSLGYFLGELHSLHSLLPLHQSAFREPHGRNLELPLYSWSCDIFRRGDFIWRYNVEELFYEQSTTATADHIAHQGAHADPVSLLPVIYVRYRYSPSPSSECDIAAHAEITSLNSGDTPASDCRSSDRERCW
jgi:hypothetical protein